jgi:hypothetical protein
MSYLTDLIQKQHLYRYSIAVNALSGTAVLIATTEASMGHFHPLFAAIKVTAVNTLVSVVALAIGTNSATYDNILTLAAAALIGLTAVDKMYPVMILPVIDSVAPSTGIYVKPSTLAVATTYTLVVHLLGFYA